ncbi:NADH-ubiquinone oxidoreductase chain G [Thioalkalivibrio nitratireducens DSM 14787]|uniref:NADH-quinone oxidoreductase subunit G n=1 Tax=Thioalkalivibrio nitratireducens (strain DSM 14787 / UNIQEM 213 / ALEN2) TaxID=1255043 RepID=L0DX77_THIND|nr:2Fe-2S iron-sulfur cluster-binding protein [Thioalkalivibrio nitratireducens]AGA33612.1 NADH-ubiquinone oxidoreductase chain G [Thioalkalivibrio nitratireducens DSM 14787]
MPVIFINGEAVETGEHRTVLQAALANGFYVPHFCWHPELSIVGNCRVCVVEQEGRGVNIACNMPVVDGMRVQTDSEPVRAQRKAMLQFILLNHPVDCGICDKAGECTLQDYHYAYNGEPALSQDPKLHSTKFYPLSDRIILDNERCILCSRCVRFTREVSQSNVLGIEYRGDSALVRPAEDRTLDDDPYSDNVIDICPVGALLSRSFLYQARAWYLEPTPSVCPGCARGCTVQLWHRKPEWRVKGLDPRHNTRILRVTPLENPRVNGPWICNKGRDLGGALERPRAEVAMLKGEPVTTTRAIEAARELIRASGRRVALVSSGGSNEELRAFHSALVANFTTFVKPDHLPQDGEVVEDDLLIRADKNPNTRAARSLFGDSPTEISADTELVLVWGEGADFGAFPRGAKIVLLGSWLAPENGYADVFIPLSIQTERRGHYTNFQGVVSAFEPCCWRPDGVIDAETLFPLLAAPPGSTA